MQQRRTLPLQIGTQHIISVPYSSDAFCDLDHTILLSKLFDRGPCEHSLASFILENCYR